MPIRQFRARSRQGDESDPGPPSALRPLPSKEYPSIGYLAGKGFRVWPAGFQPLKAAAQLNDFALAHRTEVLGYLATTWNETSIARSPDWPPIRDLLPRWRERRRNRPLDK